MKKPSPELRARQIKAARRELKKRRNREGFGRIYGDLVGYESQFEADTASKQRPVKLVDEVVLEFSGHLDLLDGARATLAQLDRIGATSLQTQRFTDIFLDLTRIESIDAASLLFLCSRVRYYGGLPHVRFFGSYPRARRALRTLQDANFAEFMAGRMPSDSGGPPNLELASGRAGLKVQPQIGDDMRTFLETRNPALTTEEAATAALAVSECLENVRKHAYENAGTRRESWYVVGQYDEETQTSSVAILDMGVGIMATLSGNLSFTQRLTLSLTGPVDYLDAATRGVLTKSGNPKQGKGLRTIREFASAKLGRSFHVLSSAARVSISSKEVLKTRTPTFPGTIVCLQICNS
jgi:hypothetical protein